MNLFKSGNFTLHSGVRSRFKIDCDALTAEDWAALASLVHTKLKFSTVVGVPNGGMELARTLMPYGESGKGYPMLLVDDVLTTGESIEEARKGIWTLYRDEFQIIGVVVFARGECPGWVWPIFTLYSWWEYG